MARARLLLLLVSTLTACKDPASEKLGDAIDDYDSERDSSRVALCLCPSALGYATEAECQDGLGDIGAAEKTCILDAFADHEQLGADYFACITPIESSYQDCLNDVFDCAPDWYVTCDETKDGEVASSCPTLPADVAAAYAACL